MGMAILIVFLILQFIYIFSVRDIIKRKRYIIALVNKNLTIETDRVIARNQAIKELKQARAELFAHKQRLEFEVKKRLSHNDLLVKRNFDMQKEIDSLDIAVNEYAGQVYRLEKEKARL